MKYRRKKWKAPNNPTQAARQVWKAAYGDSWPKGWRVEWAGFMRNTLGLTLWSRKLILLSYADAKKGNNTRHGEHGGCVGVLLHEFVHVRNPGLRHGAEFNRLVNWAWERLIGER